VLTLYSGEGEYGACKESVARQQDVIVEHVYFEWLQNSDAHEALYREIMSRSEEFDFFMKIDADMTLVAADTLVTLVDLMRAEQGLDHLSLPVYDIPSESYLMGFHIFSPRVHWTFPLDPLFPDRHPDFPGQQLIDYSHQASYVTHMSRPTALQAFALGLHRASKIVQSRRNGPINSAAFPLSYLKRVSKSQRFDPHLKSLVMRGMFHGLLFSSPAVRQKSEISHDVDHEALVCLLAFLFQTRGARDVIFVLLRIRYVHFRNVRNLMR
jgi:hypothetical protein